MGHTPETTNNKSSPAYPKQILSQVWDIKQKTQTPRFIHSTEQPQTIKVLDTRKGITAEPIPTHQKRFYKEYAMRHR